jgi:hypothetical protein
MKIATDKTIIDATQPDGHGALTVSDEGDVIDILTNDGVRHALILTPEEAVQKGVMLIQLAAHAAGKRAAANGAAAKTPNLGIIHGGRA